MSNCPNLQEIYAFRNKITANLNIFSHLTQLKKLDLGITDEMNQKNPELNNNFSGSLKALENCKDLECMCIGNQPNIKGGLEFLPAEKLTYFGCDGTAFKAILKPFDYDVYAWQLVNVKHQNNKEKAIVELSKKIKESEKKLEEAKESEDDKTQKITRLESQIQILTEKEKERITNWNWEKKTDHQQTKSQLKDLTTILFPSNNCNSFANFAFANLKRQASKISQENQESQVKISELETKNRKLSAQLSEQETISVKALI